MKDSAWNLSFLTFPGDFVCKMALKTRDLRTLLRAPGSPKPDRRESEARVENIKH